MIQTMFLCAGLGTRLRPLTEALPKPMVPLGDRPVLGQLMQRLARAGGTPRAVNVHYRSEAVVHYLEGQDPTVYVSRESELLGTAGGVRAAVGSFAREPLVVWNSDIVTQPDLLALVRGLEQSPLALLVEPKPAGAGNVGVDEKGRIVRLRCSSVAEESRGGSYVGILAMRPDCFAHLPKRGCLIGDVAIPLMDSYEGIMAIPHLARWSDIGTLQTYHQVNLRWLAEQADARAWCAPTAEVDRSVDLDCSIVGAGARVIGEGRLEQVVVWPGAHCSAPLRNAIVTREAGVIPVSVDPCRNEQDPASSASCNPMNGVRSSR
ncbi:MAG TPA: sugar phosphate nucleotidyltransferase [Polyangiaceae bacterium]|nr:sugar phosphate nucleotidyltransferase [Polyangiaceae bacterium]